jgi:hypothetical protein
LDLRGKDDDDDDDDINNNVGLYNEELRHFYSSLFLLRVIKETWMITGAY